MEQSRKAMNIGLSIIGGLALIGFIIGSFLDQEITTAMGNYNSIFGILFTMIAPVFALALGSCAGAILFFMPKIENKKRNIFFRILGAVAFVGFTGFSIKEGIEYVDFPIMEPNKTTYKVLAIVLVLIIDLAIILFVKASMKKIDTSKIIPTIVVIFIIIAMWLAVSEVIKHLASRPRPRNIDDLAMDVSFRQWYQFQPFFCFKKGYKDCKSFVSGHAFIATCTCGIIPLLHSLSKNKSNQKIQIIGLAIGGVFAFVVAFSRIVAKAHFMTDVMGGILTSIISQLVVLNVAYSWHKKKIEN